MSIKVDSAFRARALAVLNESAVAAKTQGGGSQDWESKVQTLSTLIDNGRGSGTFVAMLGTALLARAVDDRTDPFALKAGTGGAGDYSARSLCTGVLAAHAHRLNIHLGATGREPLNNQPFFSEARVHAELPVHTTARPAFEKLMDYLGELSTLNTIQARAAFISFLKVRAKGSLEELDPDQIKGIPLHVLLNAIAQFVAERSERGKRAQAVAAACLDLVAGAERVLLGRINDPDRQFPGDICVRGAAEESLIVSLEVRDKPVSENDLYHFCARLVERGVPTAGLLAVAAKQESIPVDEVRAWAAERGVSLSFWTTWADFIADVFLWRSVATVDQLPKAELAQKIWERAVLIEVSSEGLTLWKELVEKYGNNAKVEPEADSRIIGLLSFF